MFSQAADPPRYCSMTKTIFAHGPERMPKRIDGVRLMLADGHIFKATLRQQFTNNVKKPVTNEVVADVRRKSSE
jgi:hypothetical protein